MFIKYSQSSISILATNTAVVKSEFFDFFGDLLNEDYRLFQQMLGVHIKLIFPSSLSALERSYFQDSVQMLHDKYGFFSCCNGFRLNHLPNREINEKSSIRTIFSYDTKNTLQNSQLSVDMLPQTLKIKNILKLP